MDKDQASATGQDDYQGLTSRSVLEWDPETEEYRRRVEPAEEPAGMSRKLSMALDDFSDQASRLSDAGVLAQEPEANVVASGTTLVFDAETGEYRRGVETSIAAREEQSEGARTLLRRMTSNQVVDAFEYNPPELSKPQAMRQTSESKASISSLISGPDPASSAAKSGSVQPSTSEQEADFLDEASKRLFGLSSKKTAVERKLEEKVSPFTRCFRNFYRNYMFESIWLIMILIGFLMSILAWCIDELTEKLFEMRNNIGKLPNINDPKKKEGLEKWFYERDTTSAFFLWWTWAVVFGFSSILCVRYIAPQAAGSGIEQVRSIMTGYSIPGYLDMNTLVAKLVGVVTIQASGLTLGKEGPFVHIACSLASLLLSLPMFAELKKSRALTKQVISAACATGFASTFGSPIGGVLFAVEVTSNVYHTADYWKAFFTAVCGEVVFREVSYFGTARASQIALFPTTFPAQPYLLIELPGYIALSTLLGLYGGLYVKMILGIRSWRQSQLAKATAYVKEKRASAKGIVTPALEGEDDEVQDVRERDTGCCKGCCRRLGKSLHSFWMQLAYIILQQNMYAFLVISFTAIANWSTGQYMMRSLYSGIADFIVSGEMAKDDNIGAQRDPRIRTPDWGDPNLLWNLFFYFFMKSITCVLALSLQVPTGTLIPMLAIGLSIGRFFGEITQMWFGPNFIPGGYALVGASAFIAGSTGAVSTAVIIFEITAQMSYMVPVLVAVIIGRQAGKLISPDLYEALQITKNLPNIPPLTHQSSYNILAVEIMNPNNIPMLKRFSSLLDIENALNAPTFRHHDEVHDDDLFAVVDDDGHYLASVGRHQLRSVLTSSSTPVTGGENADKFDLLSIVDVNAIAPSVPITATAVDCLQMFELTLCNAMFVTDKARVVGWLDLNTIRHKCESGEL